MDLERACSHILKRIKAESENHAMESPDERRLGMEDLAELYMLNWL